MVSDFAKQIEDNIREYLPESYRNAEIKIQNTVKGNDRTMEGILIQREGENSAPVIYLEEFYERYYQGEELAGILQEIVEARVNLEGSISLDVESLKDYESLKDNLFIQMCDPEMNREFLKGKPYKLFGTLAAVYQVNIRDGEEEIGSMTVTNAHISVWGIDVEQLHQDALNAERGREIVLFDIEDITSEVLDPLGWKEENLLESDNVKERFSEREMYVLTNKSSQFGAAAIVNDDVMKRAGEIVGGDYFVLPSSKHELMLLRDNGQFTQEELEEKVRYINETSILPDDILSDKVQFYDTKTNELLPEKPVEADKEQVPGVEKDAKGVAKAMEQRPVSDWKPKM